MVITPLPAGVMVTEVPPPEASYAVLPSRSHPGAFVLLGCGLITGSWSLRWLVAFAETSASMDRRRGLDMDVFVHPACFKEAA